MTTGGGELNAVRRGGGGQGDDHSLLVELAHGRLSADEARQLLDRVAADDELSKELDLIILMMGEGMREERPTRYDQTKERGRTLREAAGPGLVLLRVAAVLLMILGAGKLIDGALAPPYAHLARMDAGELHLRIRDGSTAEVATMRAYLYEGEWEEAVRRADWYLAVHAAAPERPTVYIIRAAGFLMGARKDFVGLGLHYDRSLVDSALAALDNARSGMPSPGESEQIAWFEARSFLMKGEPDEARTRLRRIVEHGGVFVPDARRILAVLDARR